MILEAVIFTAFRGYSLENDQERYTEKRRKVYAFMRVPYELEKFLFYGFLHCLDAFCYVFTFLPIRIFVSLSEFCEFFLFLDGFDRRPAPDTRMDRRRDLRLTQNSHYCCCLISNAIRGHVNVVSFGSRTRRYQAVHFLQYVGSCRQAV